MNSRRIEALERRMYSPPGRDNLEGLIRHALDELEAGDKPLPLPVTFKRAWEMIDTAADELAPDDHAQFARFMTSDELPTEATLREMSPALYRVLEAEIGVSYSLALRVGKDAVTNHRRHRGWL